MKNKLEKRHYPMQLRLVEGDGGPRLEGHIAVFNQLSVDLGGFKEKIEPGAFAETIAHHDICAIWNHNGDLVLGRNKADTLELAEDDLGLAFKNTPPDTTWFRDCMVSLKRKDVTGCSFGFYTDADEWGTGADGTRVRTLKKITLVEVSPGVTFPAYTQTDFALRSLQAHEERERLSTPLSKAGQGSGVVVQIANHRRRLDLEALTS
jgi:Escherichia/Staphylococcus phage prohead protease